MIIKQINAPILTFSDDDFLKFIIVCRYINCDVKLNCHACLLISHDLCTFLLPILNLSALKLTRDESNCKPIVFNIPISDNLDVSFSTVSLFIF